ncbi:MAG: cob(I)alamin adenosyltransferase [Chloroflexi bacterium]|jgi:cob(I)alamin adenosyltransferase|nr:MAG: cob(I)alamin adenosyltransferase [Chloroflexota bacterium]
MDKIYTKYGDLGETGLLYGGRVPKNDPRCEAYGAVDEAISAMGLARPLSNDPRVREVIRSTQKELFMVGAELATAVDHYDTFKKHFTPVTPDMVDRLEQIIDEMNGQIELPRAFIVPGASAASGALDMARSILRRAERRIVDIAQKDMLTNPEILRYINRLADLLFMLARFEDRALPFDALTGESD